MSLVKCWYHYFLDRQACNNYAAYFFDHTLAQSSPPLGFRLVVTPPRSAGVVTFSCPSTNPVSQIASSKQKSSSKIINKAPSAQPVHAFQSSLPDINPKYFSLPGGKYKRLASPPRIARSGSVLNMGVKRLMSLLSSNAQQNWGRYSKAWFSTVSFVKRD